MKAPGAVARPRRAVLAAHLSELAGRALGIDGARLPEDRSLVTLGLDSLAAAELAGAIETDLGVAVPIAELLEGPTLAELRAAVARHRRLQRAKPAARPTPARPTAAPAAPAPATDTIPTATPTPTATRYPASPGQRALLLLDRLIPGNPAYILAGAARVVRGSLDAARLRRALAAVAARHPPLRSAFVQEGESFVQEVHAEPGVELAEVDAGGWSDDRLRAHLAEWAETPFDLGRGPLLRLAVYRRAGAPPWLALAVHHVAADFGSLGILLGDLGALYRGDALPPLDAGAYHRALAAQERGWEDDAPRRRADEAYWSAVLPATAPPLALPADRPRPPVQTARGGSLPLAIDTATTARLRALGERTGATPFMTLLALLVALLHRHSGQETVRVGTPTAGRGDRGLDGLVGYLVNPVVAVGDCAGDPPFAELLRRVRDTVIAALAHQRYPFARLAERLGGERDPSRSPLFQVMFVHYREGAAGERGLAAVALGATGGRLDLGGIELASVALPQRAAQFDLTLATALIDGAVAASLVFNRDLFDAATIRRLGGHLQVLAAAVASPAAAGPGGAPAGSAAPLSQLPLLTAAERQQLVEGNDTAVAWAAADRCLHQLIERQARRAPHAVAVVDDPAGGLPPAHLTYGELDARADALAQRLRQLGVQPDAVVPICAERSVALVVGLLGILKAGGAYLPLEPDAPAERLRLMLEDAGATLAVAQDGLAARLGTPAIATVPLDDPAAPWSRRGARPWPSPASASSAASAASAASVAAPIDGAGPANLAYVIFTSGSTGRPKGAMNTHRGIVNRLRWAERCHPLSPAAPPGVPAAPADRVLQKTPVGFDVSVWELFWPLAAGAQLVMARPGGHLDDAYLVDALARLDVTIVHFVPAMLRSFLAAVEALPAAPAAAGPRWRHLRRVLASGEALPYDLQQRFHAAVGAPLHNLYGPTEAAVEVTAWACDPAGSRRLVPIGRPVANTRIHLLDKAGRQVPAGVAGELHIGGVQLARGYLRRPDLTAEKFVPDPFAGGGARLYRTGDLARHLADGAIDYLGRGDFQLKIRGVRIEPAEIETALARHPAVGAAAVAARGEPRRLVAFVVPAPGAAAVDPGALRSWLLARLPAAMVPAQVVALAALPLTASGKLDRQALPGPAPGADGDRPAFAAPRPGLEQLIAGIWQQVLGVAPVGADDDFFALGGQSLFAAQVTARLRAATGGELALREQFEHPTVRRLAARLAQRLPDAPAPIPRRLPAAPPPLSFAQERLWFLDRLAPGSAAYNLAGALHLRGPLNLAALAASLRAIAGRHQVLRTAYPAAAGQPMSELLANFTLPTPLVDLSALAAAETAAPAAAQALASRLGCQPFDLARGPLLRTVVARLGACDHQLILVLHHIVGDGWSIGVFLRELAAIYPALAGAAAPALAELPVQYVDYAAWQRAQLAGERLEAALRHWRLALAGAPARLALPADRPRPPAQSLRGGRTVVVVPPALAGEVRQAAQRAGATLFMALLAAFAALLARWSAQQDVVVGTPVANRDRLEIEGLIGCFVNTLALRASTAGRPPAGAMLARVRQASLDAFAHQELPFDRLVEELAPVRDLAAAPLLQALLVLQNAADRRVAPIAVPDGGTLQLELREIDTATAKLDLSLQAVDTAAGLELTFEHSRDLFDAATIKRLAAHYRLLLEALAGDPRRCLDDVPLLGASDRQQLLEWNDTQVAWEDWQRRGVAAGGGPRCLHALIEEQARRSPQAIAVADAAGDCLSFGALNGAANQMARQLRRWGVGPETVAAICAERSVAATVGLVAILKAGGAYLPLDPGYPPERLRFMLADGGAHVLLAQRRLAARLGEPLPPELRTLWLDDDSWRRGSQRDLPPLATPDNLAYVIYTSGSTGRPKGTMNTHRGIVNRLLWMQQRYGLAGDDRVLQKTPWSFDVSVWELFWPLLTGARLVMAQPGAHGDPAYLRHAIAAEAITTLHFVPAMLAAFVDALPDGTAASPGGLASLRRVMASGEALSYQLMQQHAAAVGAPLHNLYGPTEAAVDVTSWATEPDGARRLVPIGRPVANTWLRLLDAAGDPVPQGIAGELLIGGVQVCRGYLGRPALTAQRFVPDPLAGVAGGAPRGARLYRTGDLARHLPDGAVDYLGRIDGQVKIRGFRVELGEIEAALLAHPAVHAAAVALRPLAAAAGAPEALVAYLAGNAAADTADDDSAAARPDAADLRGLLAARLPPFMVPAAFVWLDRLPLSPSGKVDRRALPPPPAAAATPRAPARRPPVSPAEQVVAALFTELVGVDPVGLDDDFFGLGGHSLLAARLAARVRQRFGVELPLRQIFASPTVAALARRIEQAPHAGPPIEPPPPILPAPRDRPLPLSFAQERLWFLDRLEPGGTLYNMAAALRLRGALDAAALAAALAAVARRHQVLRTVFVEVAETPVQRVLPPAAPPHRPLPAIDLTALPPPRRAAEQAALAEAEAGRAFDLARGPLLRAVLLRLAAGDHALLVSVHHIVSDAWSSGILVGELRAFYDASRGEQPGERLAAPPDLPVQYADYAVWQRRHLAGDALERQLAWWRGQLAGLPPALDLPGDRPRPAVRSARGASEHLQVPPAVAAAARRLARHGGATLSMLLLAAWKALLARATGQLDLCVGAPVAGRTHVEIEPLIGLFVNTLALRTTLTPWDTMRQIVARVREVWLDAQLRQDLPFEKLVAALVPQRSLGHSPLFQVLFDFAATDPLPAIGAPSPFAAGLTVERLPLRTATAKLDLTLTVAAAGEELRAELEYSADLFAPASARRLLGAWLRLLAAAVEQPDRDLGALPLLSEAERHQLAREWGEAPGGSAPPAPPGLHQLVEAQARAAPDAVAVAGDGASAAGHLTYGELERRAQALAAVLRRAGAGAELPVAILLPCSPQLVLAELATLKAGAAFLPLDPAHPDGRLRAILAAARPAALLTLAAWRRRAHAAGMPILVMDRQPAAAAGAGAAADDGAPRPDATDATAGASPRGLAYVMYTSGSTGAPKGVLVEHAAAVSYVRAAAGAYGLRAGDRVLHFASPGFDLSVEEIFPALASGATLVVASDPMRRAAASFLDRCREQAVTLLTLPTAWWHEICQAATAADGDGLPASVRAVVLGGERVLPARVAQWQRRFGGRVALFNTYGPTEATVVATVHRVAAAPATPAATATGAAPGSVPLGRPLAGVVLRVLDGWGAAAAAGVAGEIALGGAGVARGYLSEPARTAARFVPDPLGGAGARLYRTGDRGRWRPDGQLEFLGRLDRQVKIRGFRVEPAEIEAALAAHGGVREVAVVTAPAAGAAALAAFVVPATAAAARGMNLRRWLRRRLPEHMVPARFFALDALPRNAHGKLDRAALTRAAAGTARAPGSPPVAHHAEGTAGAAAPAAGVEAGLRGLIALEGDAAPAADALDGAGRARRHDEPAGPWEALVAAVWCELLGRDHVGRHDDFFALGGHSLLATRAVSRLRRSCAVELPLRDLFERPTVAAVAAQLDAALRAGPAGGGAAPAPLVAAPRRPGVELPLSFAQERLWFLDRLDPGDPTYNMPLAVELAGALDVPALAGALHHVVRRHESLRTTFAVAAGVPVQRIAPPPDAAPLPLADLAALPSAARAAEAVRLTAALAGRRLDLQRGPLLATLLLRQAAERHRFVAVVHHVAADGWSASVFVRELAESYDALRRRRAPTLPPLPIQYADFAIWQRAALAGARRGELAYWRRQLADPAGDRLAALDLDLPTDRPRPAAQTYRGGRGELRLDPDLARRLRGLCRGEGATLFMGLLAALEVVLHRHSGQLDFAVGAPVAGRRQVETEALIGCFLNTLVLRADLSGEPSFRTLLGRARTAALGAYAHQDVPFEALLAELRPERDLARTPLFQVMLNLLNLPPGEIRLAGLRLATLPLPEVRAKFDLTFYVDDRPPGDDGAIAIELVYNADLFDAPRMTDLLAQIAAVVAQAAAHPDAAIARLSLVTAGAAAVLPDPADPAQALDATWHGAVDQLFAQQSRRDPDRPAIEDGAATWSRGEVHDAARLLALRLAAAGVGGGDRVAIYAHRSAPLVPALLATFAAGAAFFILDPAYPPARQLAILRLAQPRAWLGLAAAGEPPADVAAWLAAAGCPRWVLPRGGAAALRAWLAAQPPIAPRAAGAPRQRQPGADDLACIGFTSGSTGTPKGILGRHGSLTHFLPWMRQRFGLSAADRFAMLSALPHDPLQREIFTPLCLGAAIVIPDADAITQPGRLAAWMAAARITVANLTPALSQVIAEPPPGGAAAPLPDLRCVMWIGEALARRDAARIRRLAPRAVCLNLYGATETQRALAYHVADPDALEAGGDRRDAHQVLPLGRGMQGAQLLVCGRHGDLAGIGELGQIVMRSPHLALGYLDDAALTAEKFAPCPLGGVPGERLYLTGDLGRFLPDGEVAFAGRADRQCKIRGFRVEPAEVEARLGALAEVREAAVVPIEARDGGWQLAACVTPRAGATIAAADLRRALRRSLPEYMVPATVVELAALPRTPTGKLDRRALARLAADPAAGTPAAAAPPRAAARTAAEARLVDIFGRLLGVAAVGIHDNFFELGGHSLLGMRLIAAVAAELGRELPIRTLFEAPTPAELAARLADGRAGDAIPRLARSAPRAEMAPSFAQQRLWFLERLAPGNAIYNLAMAVSLHGPLSPAALAGSLAASLRRHESLRTAFRATADGDAVQVIDDDARLALPLVDLAAARRLARREAERLAVAFGRRPFDLRRAPLLRAALLRLADGEHVLLLAMHHIVSDGWSIRLLVHELAVQYQALAAVSPAAARLPELAIQYADFAAWQRRRLSAAVIAGELDFWRRRLAGAPPLQLATDRPRPAVPSGRGAVRPLAVSRPLAAALGRLCRDQNVTLFMALTAGFGLLLGRYSGQHDLTLGTPVAGRGHPATAGLVGFFVNTLVLRLDLGGNPAIGELLQRVRATALDAYAHQELPFEQLVGDLQPVRDLSRTPLFQAMLALQQAPPALPAVAGLRLAEMPAPTLAARFDLTLALRETGGDLAGGLEYRADLFEPATVERLAGHLCNLLAGLAAAGGGGARTHDLPLLFPAERHQVTIEWNSSAWAAGGDDLVHQPFERHAARHPQAVALVECGAAAAGNGRRGRTLRYGQLAGRVERLASQLRRLGVGPEQVVGICGEPSFALIVALLAVLKAGGAYLPLDPTLPAERLAGMAADAGVRLVLADQPLAGRFGAAARAVPLDRPGAPSAAAAAAGEPHPDHPAYVLYTSGSTGKPKGVVVSHRAVVNRLRYQVAADLAPGARVLQRTRLAFDISVVEIFAPLWMGGAVLVVPPERHQEAGALASLLAGERVTNLTLPPALWPVLLAEPAFRANRWLRRLVTGGDRVPGDLPPRYHAAMAQPAPALVARYGPTEAAVSVSEWLCGAESPGQTVPLGRPIAGASLHLLDRALSAVPPGASGELCIAGSCLARGYLGRPELTAAAFVPNPFASPDEAGSRLYRTGDLARQRADGVVEFLGRLDGQVKVRGFRIELGEIEAALAAHPDVRAAAAAVRDRGGDDRLVGYVVARPERAAGAAGTALLAELRQALAARLPAYMVPAETMLIDALPLNANGKLDRKALPDPSPAAGDGGDGGVRALPRTPAEHALADLFRAVLACPAVGVDDNFFALGGHSLLALRLAARIRDTFGRDLPLAALLRAPTVAGLAALLQTDAQATPARRTALVELTPAAGPAPADAPAAPVRPLFCVHPAGGNVLCYAELARALGPAQPFYGLQLPELADLGPEPTIETLAAHYVAALPPPAAPGAPPRPYALGGWSLGGAIAYEMARQLRAAGRPVQPLVLIDPAPLRRAAAPRATAAAQLKKEFLRDLCLVSGGAAQLARLDATFAADVPLSRLVDAAHSAGLLPAELAAGEVERLFALFQTTRRALDRYRPVAAPGPLTLLLASRRSTAAAGRARTHPADAWAALAGAGTEIQTLPGDHYSIVRPPAVAALAASLRRLLGS